MGSTRDTDRRRAPRWNRCPAARRREYAASAPNARRVADERHAARAIRSSDVVRRVSRRERDQIAPAGAHPLAARQRARTCAPGSAAPRPRAFPYLRRASRFRTADGSIGGVHRAVHEHFDGGIRRGSDPSPGMVRWLCVSNTRVASRTAIPVTSRRPSASRIVDGPDRRGHAGRIPVARPSRDDVWTPESRVDVVQSGSERDHENRWILP